VPTRRRAELRSGNHPPGAGRRFEPRHRGETATAPSGLGRWRRQKRSDLAAARRSTTHEGQRPDLWMVLLATGGFSCAAHASQPQLKPPGTGYERAPLRPKSGQHVHCGIVDLYDFREIQNGRAVVDGIDDHLDGVTSQRPYDACPHGRALVPGDHEPRIRGGRPRRPDCPSTTTAHVSSPLVALPPTIRRDCEQRPTVSPARRMSRGTRAERENVPAATSRSAGP
jgi:hypothetical protein